MWIILTPILIAAIAAIAILLLLLASYVKAPPDKAYIISGFHKEPKILIGRAGLRIPFLERMDMLYLGQITVDIKTEKPVPTNDFINVDVDAVAKIRVSPDAHALQQAAKNFLNKKSSAIAAELQDSLQGNMREIIGTLSLKDINTDRDSFSDQVMQKAQQDMDKLGIEILSCNIQNVSDENGLIKDLGADNTARIKKDAAIAKAGADRDVAVARAQAETEANAAQVTSQTEIAKRNTQLAIQQAELKIESDTKQAEADAAYSIQQETQRRSIEVARVEADIAKKEKESDLADRQVALRERQLDAEVRKQADAMKYKTEKEAEANLIRRQKEAEAKRFEQVQAAEASRFEQEQAAEAAKRTAEATKYSREQEAAGIAAVGKAEAEAIQAKALAEAEGIDAKAEAMKKYGEAAVVEMIMHAMPEIAKNIAEPLSKVDKITMYGEGNSAKLIQDIVNGTTQVTEGMTQGLGLDLKSILAGFLGGKIAADGKTEQKPE